MTKGGSEKMKIKIDTETGEVDKIRDENNFEATEMTPEEIQQMYQSPDGPRHIGIILQTHSSPKCMVYCSGGKCYQICR